MQHRSNRWLRGTLAALSAATLGFIAACGGGGGNNTTTTETATAYSQGVITGFGSVIVNGVRWDDSAATVLDDDGTAHASSELKLGMTVEIEGAGFDRSRGAGRALFVHYGSEMKGPISAVDATASTLTVLGQTVEITTSTVFDESISGGIAGLSAGQVVEVFGLFDATNARVVATRIELEDSATEYRLRGIVSSLDTTAKTFMIGTELISYADTDGVPASLADGLQVKVGLQTTQVDGAWVATRVRLIGRSLMDMPEAGVEGVITEFTSTTSFAVNGIQVDATNAVFEDGTDGIVLGARVEVEGSVVDGVLVATKVEIDDERHHGPKLFELHGAISNLDTTAQTFSLRGLTVSYAGEVEFKNGTVDNLVDGARVEVKGTLSDDLTIVNAARIDFHGD